MWQRCLPVLIGTTSSTGDEFVERFDEKGGKNDNVIQDLEGMKRAAEHASAPFSAQHRADNTANEAQADMAEAPLGFMNRLNPRRLRGMPLNDVFRCAYLIVFGMLIIFSIIALSDSAFLVSMFNANNNNTNLGERDLVRFIMFSSTWTLVTAAAAAH